MNTVTYSVFCGFKSVFSSENYNSGIALARGHIIKVNASASHINHGFSKIIIVAAAHS